MRDARQLSQGQHETERQFFLSGEWEQNDVSVTVCGEWGVEEKNRRRVALLDVLENMYAEN